MKKLLISAIFGAWSVQPAICAIVQVTANPVTVVAPVNSVVASVTAAASGVPIKATQASVASTAGTLGITQDQFIKAWTNGKQFLPDPNIPAPNTDQYNAFINNASSKGGITTKTELAMFLAEIMWESGGLYYKAELACKTNNCAGSYQDSTGIPGKYYYGRGYIQLTWGANYKAASTALYGDDRILQNPDQVATDENSAWGVSFWFWKTNVKPALKNTFNFGLATNAINGALECKGSATDKAKKRFQIYTAILKVFEPSATPIETGCYN